MTDIMWADLQQALWIIYGPILFVQLALFAATGFIEALFILFFMFYRRIQ